MNKSQCLGEVLVVDDTQTSLKLLSDILATAGYSVRQAQDGGLALLTVKARLPELILLDITMPGIDGYEVCRRLKSDAHTRDVPVVFLSALNDTASKIQGFRLGAADYIEKPYEAEEVLLRVRTQLEMHRLRKSLETAVLERTAELQERTETLQEEVRIRRETEQQLRLAGKVFDASFDAIIVTDGQHTALAINPAFTRITKYVPEDVVGKRGDVLRSDRHDQKFYDDIFQAVHDSGSWTGEMWCKHKNGNVSPMMTHISVIRESDGQPVNYVLAFVDLSEMKDSQTLINFLAHHDALTGLPNRVVARKHFEDAKHEAELSGEKMAVMCIDLDRFKVINDSIGHNIGDQVLKRIAESFSECLPAGDMISRQGGDEFLLIYRSSEGKQDISDIAQCVVEKVHEEISIHEHRFCLSASVGVSLYPEDGETLEDLIKGAENALYTAKNNGGNGYCFFAKEMDVEACLKMDIENRLRDALSLGELQVHYQPKVSLSSGEIVGAEALLRWNSAALGFVSPARFIPIAEESGLIHSIGEWVLNTVCAQIHAWGQKGLGHTKVSVNLCGLQFRQKNFAALVADTLRNNGVSPSCLDLEITESILIDDAKNAISILEELKRIGVGVSLDDFGTGYSSLSYLRKLPIDTLKIDKSFIDEVLLHADGEAITLTVIALSKNLKLNVVAEGVETREQCEFLREHGCDEIQGYYFSPAVAADKFESMLKSRRRLPEVTEIVERRSVKH